MSLSSLWYVLISLRNSKSKADIQVEAGRIDHAGHANDAAGIIHDVLAYNEVWTETVKWIDSHGKNKNNYIVLATADHDTGALNLPGGWLPASLVNVTNSVEYLADWLEEKSEGVTGDDLTMLIEGVLVDKLALNITAIDPEHMSLLVEAVSTGSGIAGNLTELRNLESGLNWGTGGHSSVDVSLYLYPQDDEELVDSVQGLHPNVWLGQWIEGYLGLDLASVKAKLESDGSLRNETRREEILSGPVISE
jgi:alkaline phosphatase